MTVHTYDRILMKLGTYIRTYIYVYTHTHPLLLIYVGHVEFLLSDVKNELRTAMGKGSRIMSSVGKIVPFLEGPLLEGPL